MLIRRFRPGDEAALAQVAYTSVHELAKQDYTAEQLEAWMPTQFDANKFGERMRGLQPFVAEIDGVAVGYADLQPSGYIDHFFVAGAHARRGVGTALMETIHGEARRQNLSELFANVSLTAEAFFAKHGFAVEARQSVVTRGVEMRNARMRKLLRKLLG